MYGDDAIFRALPFARCMLYFIYTIINENFKPRAIEPCKSEVLTLYRSRDMRRRKGVIKLKVGLRVSYRFTLSMVTEKLLRLYVSL